MGFSSIKLNAVLKIHHIEYTVLMCENCQWGRNFVLSKIEREREKWFFAQKMNEIKSNKILLRELIK